MNNEFVRGFERAPELPNGGSLLPPVNDFRAYQQITAASDQSCPYLPNITTGPACFNIEPFEVSWNPAKFAEKPPALDRFVNTISPGQAYDVASLALGLPQPVREGHSDDYAGQVMDANDQFNTQAAARARQYLAEHPEERVAIEAELARAQRDLAKTMNETGGNSASEDMKVKYPHLAAFTNWIISNTGDLDVLRRAALDTAWNKLTPGQQDSIARQSMRTINNGHSMLE